MLMTYLMLYGLDLKYLKTVFSAKGIFLMRFHLLPLFLADLENEECRTMLSF